MACCRRACSRRTASSSALTELRFSVGSFAVAGIACFPSAEQRNAGAAWLAIPFRGTAGNISVSAIITGLTQRTYTRRHVPSEKNGAAPELVRAFGEFAQCARRRYALSESFHIPKPRRAAGRGSSFRPSDRGNASATQTLCSKTPQVCHHEGPGNCASSLRRHQRHSDPAPSEESARGAERLLLGRAALE